MQELIQLWEDNFNRLYVENGQDEWLKTTPSMIKSFIAGVIEEEREKARKQVAEIAIQMIEKYHCGEHKKLKGFLKTL